MSQAVCGLQVAAAYSNCGLTSAWYALCLTSLEHGPKFLPMMPSVARALARMLAMWCLNVKSLDIVTPRYLWRSLCSITWPETQLSNRDGDFLRVIDRLWHLEALNDICHLSAQLKTSVRSFWRVWWSSCPFISLYRIQSSANNLMVEFSPSAMSFM